MQIINPILPVVALLFLAALLSPRVRENQLWRATVTPLASIIGSGFLIIAPLLGGIVGPKTPLAMLLIVITAYLIGSVIRHNICYAEQRTENRTASTIQFFLEHLSNFGLLGAYIISVAFYLRLMSAFILDGFGIFSETNANLLTTAVLAFIGIVGWLRGLGALERLEEYSVSIKLAIIGAFLVGLTHFSASTGLWDNVPSPPERSTFETMRMLAGMLLVVQGFETSRYLGREYPAIVRVHSMQFAQIVSALIYIGFAFLILPLLQYLPAGQLDETAIINLSRHVSVVLPVMLIFAATMSQFSAAVADTLGGGGMISEESQAKIPPGYGYLAITICAILLVWSTSIFEIVAFASRAFAFYYFIQTLIAFHVATGQPGGPKKWLRLTGFGLMAVLLAGVTIFAIPMG